MLYGEQNREVSATSLSPLFGLYINLVMIIEICATVPILSFLKFLVAREPLVKWVSGTQSGRIMKPSGRVHPVPRFRMCVDYTCTPTPIWRHCRHREIFAFLLKHENRA